MGVIYLNELKISKKEFRIIVVGVIVFCYVFFNFLFDVVSPFIYALLVSICLIPLVNFFEKKFKLKRKIAICLTMIIAFLVMYLTFFILYKVAKNYLIGYILSFIEYIDVGSDFIENFIESIYNELTFIPTELKDVLFSGVDMIFSALPSLITSMFDDSIITSIPSSLFNFIIMILATIFIIIDKEELMNTLKSNLSKKTTDVINILKVDVFGAIKGYFKSQIKLMGVVFVILLIGLFILKTPYFFFFAILISVVDALPVFGSGFFLWPMSLIAFISGDLVLGISYLVIYAVTQLIKQIVQPKLIGDEIGLSPLFTLFGLFVGFQLIGVVGLIIGPLVCTILKCIHSRIDK